MRVVILGSTGMLGHAVGRYFIDQYSDDNVYLSYQNKKIAYGKNRFYFKAETSDLSYIPECDYLLNCIGIIKPFMKNNIINAISINSLFPWMLSEFCQKRGTCLIHITTDCVFSGKTGQYTEKSLHDCLDDYGKTKSLGEPDNCMVIRTSIIGKEIHKNASLIAWAQSQKGQKVTGFVNHHWNGVTTKQYAKICDQIIKQNLYKEELYHIFSNIVSKYELLHLINDRFNLNLIINKYNTPELIDRTLATVKELNGKLHIPALKEQLADL